MLTIELDVATPEEGAQLRAGLALPDVRAFVCVMGVLTTLPSNRARVRVLEHVQDMLEERDDRDG